MDKEIIKELYDMKMITPTNLRTLFEDGKLTQDDLRYVLGMPDTDAIGGFVDITIGELLDVLGFDNVHQALLHFVGESKSRPVDEGLMAEGDGLFQYDKRMKIEIYYTDNGLSFEEFYYEADETLEQRDIAFLVSCFLKNMIHDEDHSAKVPDDEPDTDLDKRPSTSDAPIKEKEEEDYIHVRIEEKTTYHLYNPKTKNNTACGHKGSTTTEKKDTNCGSCKKTKLFKESK